MSTINKNRDYWLIVLLCLVILGCSKKQVKLTQEQLANSIAFAAYPHQTKDKIYSSSKEIYIIKAETNTEPIRITYSNNWEEQPVWVDDGNSLVFKRCIGEVGSPQSRWYLYKKNLLFDEEGRLFKLEHQGTETKARRNVYLLRYSHPHSPLYSVDINTDSISKIFDVRDLGISIKGKLGEIWDFSIDREERRFALTIAEGARLKGKMLVDERRKCYEIAIVNRDGTNFQILTNDTFPDRSPAISPDGKFIAFTSKRDGYDEIFIMEIATRKIKRLTDPPMHAYSPTWSPDGKKIAFISERDGYAHIWVIDAEGTGLYQLTRGEFHVWSGISWSPR